jgi:uncharacterized protein (DUF2236 family)
MTLDREDIQAIAAEVVRQLKASERVRDDIQYLATLPVAEAKRILKERRGK